MPSGIAPLRIALLGYRSHPHVGGQGIYVKYLSKALVDAGHAVTVISGPPYPDLDPRVKLVELPSLDLFATKSHVLALRWRHLKSFTDTFEWFSMLTGGFSEPYTFGRRATKYFRKHAGEYDIVHDNQSLCYGLLEIEKLGIPVVATVHHPITRDYRLALAAARWRDKPLVARWHSFLHMQKKVARKLKHVVTVSEQSQQDIAEAFHRPAERTPIMYNGIDTDTFHRIPGIAREDKLLITTASADQPLKGLRYLLKAVAKLRAAAHPELRLLVIGKLKQGGSTARLLKRLKLQDAVSFVSGISTEALVEHYNRACLAVTPSLYEGFGLPAGEAMACETPVISSDGGALPEVVGDAGYLVRAGDSEALARAIDELLADEQQRNNMAAAGRARIVAQFSWREKARRLTHYYHSIIGEASNSDVLDDAMLADEVESGSPA
ncbi:MAG: glycosyltransferase family 4 protein [Gammaproteobacteria bacterium]|nr:glycosyltransferase family 4 protein [Gammaproteobacteria bacterium]NNL11941.1 glycosyltransferase family 4 protein [Pseudomonadales bacterium]RZV56227.1 MAG: glycosyltransferase family 1 protein [Pseudomonadales bacterium]